MENNRMFDYVESLNEDIDYLYKALGALDATAVLLSRKSSIRDETVEVRSLECAIDVISIHLKSISALTDKIFSRDD